MNAARSTHEQSGRLSVGRFSVDGNQACERDGRGGKGGCGRMADEPGNFAARPRTSMAMMAEGLKRSSETMDVTQSPIYLQ